MRCNWVTASSAHLPSGFARAAAWRRLRNNNIYSEPTTLLARVVFSVWMSRPRDVPLETCLRLVSVSDLDVSLSIVAVSAKMSRRLCLERRGLVEMNVKPHLHDITCCQTRLTTGLTTGCIVYTAG